MCEREREREGGELWGSGERSEEVATKFEWGRRERERGGLRKRD